MATKCEGESSSGLLIRLTEAERDPLSGFRALADAEFADHTEDVCEDLDEDFEDRTDELLGR